MLKIDLSKDSEKFLTRLPPKHGRQIARKLEQMLENPHPHDAEQMKGYPFLRVDIGEYRIIYEIRPNILSIVLIGKRNDDEVYRKLKRKY
jgi:mRNA interferase RelE/StbE